MRRMAIHAGMSVLSSARRLRAHLVVVLVTSSFTACGEATKDLATDTPWVTTVDSTADTIVVRIAGEIPERLHRTLVPELRIGAEDGVEETTFGNILAVLPTRDGGMVVYDQQVPAVRMFDAQGGFVRNMSTKGGGPGEFGHLSGITALPDGRWVLWDAAGSRLNVHALDGTYERSTKLLGGRTFGRGMLFSDVSGYLYMDAIVWRDPADRSISKRGLIRFDSAGTLLDTLQYPDWGDAPRELKAGTPDGGSTITWGVPYTPSSVTALLRSGGFVSGPSAPYRFYILRRDGARPIRVEREHVPVPVADDERTYWTAQIEKAMRDVEPAWRWTDAPIPEFKPAYRDIFVGLDGRIWVQLETVAEPIPEDELAPLKPGQLESSRRRTRTREVYDVFTERGALLGRVVVPRSMSVNTARGDQVWGTVTDASEVPYAMRAKVEPAFPRD